MVADGAFTLAIRPMEFSSPVLLENANEPQHENETQGNTQQPQDNRHRSLLSLDDQQPVAAGRSSDKARLSIAASFSFATANDCAGFSAPNPSDPVNWEQQLV
jgi:hypothetical protein